jgi:hypothetical protein
LPGKVVARARKEMFEIREGILNLMDEFRGGNKTIPLPGYMLRPLNFRPVQKLAAAKCRLVCGMRKG